MALYERIRSTGLRTVQASERPERVGTRLVGAFLIDQCPARGVLVRKPRSRLPPSLTATAQAMIQALPDVA
jgi:hypothetical protein